MTLSKKPANKQQEQPVAISLKNVKEWQDVLAALEFSLSNMPFQLSQDGSTSNKETIARLIREMFQQIPKS